MTGYMDIFVIPVPQARLDDYRQLAEMSAEVWLEHGAIDYFEVDADDVKAGKWTSFPQSVELKDGERVVVALITYRSRAHRDEVNGRAMADPRIAGMKPETVPFDPRRMFWGGFKPLVGTIPAAEPRIQPYLFFRGRCEEAIAFYRQALGAEVRMMMRFRENPDHPSPDAVPAELGNRIMHAAIQVAGTTIMMSDGMKSGPLDFQCMSLSITARDEREADRMFGALSEGGKAEMAMGPTFFASRFGAVTDKFGVAWMIIVPLDAQGS